MKIEVNLSDTSACGVYVITNLVNMKRYIGSTMVSFKERWYEHKRLLRLGTHRSHRLQKSWKKHGEENFEFSIICVCQREFVLEMENYFIEFFDSFNPEKGYNLSKVSNSQKGVKRSPETIERMRKAMTGHGHTLETRLKMSKTRKGRKYSPEHCAKISAGLLGKKKSEQAKKNIKAAESKRLASLAITVAKRRESKLLLSAQN